MKKRIIGVTDCNKYEIYRNWIQLGDRDAEVVKLDSNGHFEKVEQCNGIVLTGGEDVHPRFYNKPEYFEFCYEDDVDEKRDEFELNILSFTQQNNIPVLGICRGLQIANVFFGGTLIPDIPTWGKLNHSKQQDGSDKYHAVQVDPSSWFCNLVKAEAGIINSNHHQCADRIGSGLVVSAFSPDGVPEALEWMQLSKSFLCLVQWHPERMTDQQSVFVRNIRTAFYDAIV